MSNVGLVLVHYEVVNHQHKEIMEKLVNIIRLRSEFKIIEIAHVSINESTIEEAIEAAAIKGAKKVILIPILIFKEDYTMTKIIGLNEGRIMKKDIEIVHTDYIDLGHIIANLIEEKAFQTPNNITYQSLSSDILFKKSIEKIRQILRDFLETLPNRHARIIERIVHATADPELSKLTFISEGAIDVGIKAIKAGAKVVTDVKMVMAGINSSKLKRFGGNIECYMDKVEVLRIAKERNLTRTAAAMRLAIEKGLNEAIVVIGNSPTATFELASAIHKGEAKPALIIATPVGLIGAIEAKEAIMKLPIPHITIKGHRGGSPVAAAIFNALLEIAESNVEGG